MVIQRRSRTPLHERASEHGVIAALVLARREELGLRQTELAELADCSARFVHAIESGKTSLQLDKLLSVLDTLGLHLEIARGTSSGTDVVANEELTVLYPLEDKL